MKRLSIVVGILAILFCIIAYQLITYRLNEDLAIQTMKRIDAAQKAYKAGNGKGKYGSLGDLVASGLLSPALSDGKDRGYLFEVEVKDDYYCATAKPEVYGSSGYQGTGGISVFVDTAGHIKVIYKEGQAPVPDDFPPTR
ncbi:MAG: hypothetical protein MN733_43400 [Nitrososphaera sp.]|nr:hypothetical protein [Nitrososphaera sp.]